MIFCAAADELAERFPWLAQAHDDDNPDVSCVDLAVDVDSRGRLVSVELESLSLAGTLRSVGQREPADLLEAALGTPVSEGLRVVVSAVEALFGRD